MIMSAIKDVAKGGSEEVPRAIQTVLREVVKQDSDWSQRWIPEI